MTAGRILHRRTPYTGFEPASLLQPTVFKTAPSPPGHTANIAWLIARTGISTHNYAYPPANNDMRSHSYKRSV